MAGDVNGRLNPSRSAKCQPLQFSVAGGLASPSKLRLAHFQVPMANQSLSHRLRFLTNAAHLIAITAPETSAHLMQRCNALFNDGNQPPGDNQRQHACTCCGHIFEFGVEDVLQIKSAGRTPRKKSRRASMAAAPVQVSYSLKKITCSKCGRYTKVALQPPKRSSQNGGSKVQAVVVAAADQPKPSHNAASKKRAKARKAGLQALLEQSRSSGKQASMGLSLADFAKK
jgi:hypothetical protein